MDRAARVSHDLVAAQDAEPVSGDIDKCVRVLIVSGPAWGGRVFLHDNDDYDWLTDLLLLTYTVTQRAGGVVLVVPLLRAHLRDQPAGQHRHDGQAPRCVRACVGVDDKTTTAGSSVRFGIDPSTQHHNPNPNPNTDTLPLQLFQIDDGYQRAWGDWLTLDAGKFPTKSMRDLVELIRAQGLRPGLWLAPVAVDKHSRIAAEYVAHLCACLGVR